MAYKLVHYINQFFAGIGGEDKADVSPEVRDGIVGPGMAFKAAFNGEAEIVATFICGDNYCANHLDDVAAHMVETVKAYGADGLIAGPAFNAGRYGTACGAVCAAVAKELQLPVVSGMYRESPGVDLYRKEVTIVETADSARGMGKAVPAMAAVMLKLLKGEAIADPEAAGVFPKGIRKNMFYEQPGAERAVQMLIKKLNGEAFRTEYPMPVFDRVEPRPAIADISKATIAIVTSGGIVPFGNPDHIAASSAQNYGAYDLDGVTDLQIVVDVVDVGVGDLGYVHQTAPAVRQAHKRAKLRDTGDGTLHNCSDFHLHTVRFSLLNHSCRKKSFHRA